MKKEKKVTAAEETIHEVAAPVVEAVQEPEVRATKKSAITKVVFTRKDTSTREFSKTVHGEDFLTIADEFALTNARFIVDRKDA